MAPNRRRRTDRLQRHCYHSAGVELYHRLLHSICQFGHSGHHIRAIIVRRWLSVIRYFDVFELGSSMGFLRTGIHQHCIDPGASALLHVWCENTRVEQICAYLKGADSVRLPVAQWRLSEPVLFGREAACKYRRE